MEKRNKKTKTGARRNMQIKRIFTAFLTLVMILSLAPIAVFATPEDELQSGVQAETPAAAAETAPETEETPETTENTEVSEPEDTNTDPAETAEPAAEPAENDPATEPATDPAGDPASENGDTPAEEPAAENEQGGAVESDPADLPTGNRDFQAKTDEELAAEEAERAAAEAEAAAAEEHLEEVARVNMELSVKVGDLEVFVSGVMPEDAVLTAEAFDLEQARQMVGDEPEVILFALNLVITSGGAVYQADDFGETLAVTVKGVAVADGAPVSVYGLLGPVLESAGATFVGDSFMFLTGGVGAFIGTAGKAPMTKSEHEITTEADGFEIKIFGNLPDDAEVAAVSIPTDVAKALVDALTEDTEGDTSSKAMDVVFAFDINIISEGVKYQPADFGEDVRVTLKKLEGFDPEITEKLTVIHTDSNITGAAEAAEDETIDTAETVAIIESTTEQEIQENLESVIADIDDGNVAAEVVDVEEATENEITFYADQFSEYIGVTADDISISVSNKLKLDILVTTKDTEYLANLVTFEDNLYNILERTYNLDTDGITIQSIENDKQEVNEESDPADVLRSWAQYFISGSGTTSYTSSFPMGTWTKLTTASPYTVESGKIRYIQSNASQTYNFFVNESDLKYSATETLKCTIGTFGSTTSNTCGEAWFFFRLDENHENGFAVVVDNHDGCALFRSHYNGAVYLVKMQDGTAKMMRWSENTKASTSKSAGSSGNVEGDYIESSNGSLNRFNDRPNWDVTIEIINNVATITVEGGPPKDASGTSFTGNKVVIADIYVGMDVFPDYDKVEVPTTTSFMFVYYDRGYFANFSRQTIGSKAIKELLLMPTWRDDADKVIVNVEDHYDANFTKNTDNAARILDDDISFIEWGMNTSTDAEGKPYGLVDEDGNAKTMGTLMEEWRSSNNIEGIFIDTNHPDTTDNSNAYADAVNRTADYISQLVRLHAEGGENLILAGDDAVITVTPDGFGDEAQISEEFPGGRWYIDHDQYYFDNAEGYSSYIGTTAVLSDVRFDLPGAYYIYFDATEDQVEANSLTENYTRDEHSVDNNTATSDDGTTTAGGTVAGDDTTGADDTTVKARNYVQKVVAHRLPVAEYTYAITEIPSDVATEDPNANITFVNNSHDDDSNLAYTTAILNKETYPGAGQHTENGETVDDIATPGNVTDTNGLKGLKSVEWTYKKDGDSSFQKGVPSVLEYDRQYIIRLKVTDWQGATDTSTKYLKFSYDIDPPVAKFSLNSNNISMFSKLTVTDKSYDPGGLFLKTYTWTLKKDNKVIRTVTETMNTNGTIAARTSAEAEIAGEKFTDNSSVHWPELINFEGGLYGDETYVLGLAVVNYWQTASGKVMSETSDTFSQTIVVTGDAVDPSLTVTPTYSIWTKDDVTVQISASDTDSGLKKVEYYVDAKRAESWTTIDNGTIPAGVTVRALALSSDVWEDAGVYLLNDGSKVDANLTSTYYNTSTGVVTYKTDGSVAKVGTIKGLATVGDTVAAATKKADGSVDVNGGTGKLYLHIRVTDGGDHKVTKNVGIYQIDKELPTVTVGESIQQKVDSEGNRYLLVSATAADGSGSGVERYILSQDTSEPSLTSRWELSPTVEIHEDEFNTLLSESETDSITYYVYARDAAENIGRGSVKITQADFPQSYELRYHFNDPDAAADAAEDPAHIITVTTDDAGNAIAYGGGDVTLLKWEDLNFEPDGWSFKTWNTEKDGSGTTYAAEAKVKDLTVWGTGVDLYAQWMPNSEAGYKVYYYYKTLNEETGEYEYPASPENPSEIDISRSDRVGVKVTASPADLADKVWNGLTYVFDEDGPLNHVTDQVDRYGKTVLRLCFRNLYKVTFDPGDHSNGATAQSFDLDIGEKVPAAPTFSPAVGYKRDGWLVKDAQGNYVIDIETGAPQILTDAQVAAGTVSDHVTYVQNWKGTSTIFNVEYYYQNDDGVYELSSADSGTVRSYVGNTATVVTDGSAPINNTGTTTVSLKPVADPFEAKESEYDRAFVLDEEKSILTGTVLEGGELKLKVYYKQQYVITYTQGEYGTPGTTDYNPGGGIFNTRTVTGVDFGAPVPPYPGTADTSGVPLGKSAYKFSSWVVTDEFGDPVTTEDGEPYIPETVDQNYTFTATWVDATRVTYAINYNLQTLTNTNKYSVYTPATVVRDITDKLTPDSTGAVRISVDVDTETNKAIDNSDKGKVAAALLTSDIRQFDGFTLQERNNNYNNHSTNAVISVAANGKSASVDYYYTRNAYEVAYVQKLANNSYRVLYQQKTDYGEGEVNTRYLYEASTPTYMGSVPVQTGYDFVGWDILTATVDDSGNVTGYTVQPTESGSVNAKVDCKDIVPYLPVTTDSGSATIGNEDSNTDNFGKVEGVVVYVARFEPTEYTIKFNKNGVSDDTTSMASQIIAYSDDDGDTVKLNPNEFVREGYNFLGWATSENGAKAYDNQGEIVQKTLVDLDEDKDTIIDLYALWEEIQYDIDYDSGTDDDINIDDLTDDALQELIQKIIQDNDDLDDSEVKDDDVDTLRELLNEYRDDYLKLYDEYINLSADTDDATKENLESKMAAIEEKFGDRLKELTADDFNKEDLDELIKDKDAGDLLDDLTDDAVKDLIDNLDDKDKQDLIDRLKDELENGDLTDQEKKDLEDLIKDLEEGNTDNLDEDDLDKVKETLKEMIQEDEEKKKEEEQKDQEKNDAKDKVKDLPDSKDATDEDLKDLVDDLTDDDVKDLIDDLDDEDLEKIKDKLQEELDDLKQKEPKTEEDEKKIEELEDLLDKLSEEPPNTDDLTGDEIDKIKDAIKDVVDDEDGKDTGVTDKLKDTLDDKNKEAVEDLVDKLDEEELEDVINNLDDKDKQNLIDKLQDELDNGDLTDQEKKDLQDLIDKLGEDPVDLDEGDLDKVKETLKDLMDEEKKEQDKDKAKDKLDDLLDPSDEDLKDLVDDLTDKETKDLVGGLDDKEKDELIDKLTEMLDDDTLTQKEKDSIQETINKLREEPVNTDDLTDDDLDNIKDALKDIVEDEAEKEKAKDDIQDKLKDKDLDDDEKKQLAEDLEKLLEDADDEDKEAIQDLIDKLKEGGDLDKDDKKLLEDLSKDDPDDTSALTDKLKDENEKKNDEKIKDTVKDIVDNMDDDDIDDLIDALEGELENGDLSEEEKQEIQELIDKLKEDPINTDDLTDDELDKLKDVIKDQIDKENEQEKKEQDAKDKLDDLLDPTDEDLKDLVDDLTEDELDKLVEGLGDDLDALKDKIQKNNPGMSDDDVDDLINKLKNDETDLTDDELNKIKDALKDIVDDESQDEDDSSLTDKLKEKNDEKVKDAVKDVVENLDDDSKEDLIDKLKDELENGDLTAEEKQEIQDLIEKLEKDPVDTDELTPEDLDKLKDVIKDQIDDENKEKAKDELKKELEKDPADQDEDAIRQAAEDLIDKLDEEELDKLIDKLDDDTLDKLKEELGGDAGLLKQTPLSEDELDTVKKALEDLLEKDPTGDLTKDVTDALDELIDEEDKGGLTDKLKDQLKDQIEEEEKEKEKEKAKDDLKDILNPSDEEIDDTIENLTDDEVKDLIDDLDEEDLDKLVEGLDDDTLNDLKEKIQENTGMSDDDVDALIDKLKNDGQDVDPEDLKKIKDALDDLIEEEAEKDKAKDNIQDKLKDGELTEEDLAAIQDDIEKLLDDLDDSDPTKQQIEDILDNPPITSEDREKLEELLDDLSKGDPDDKGLTDQLKDTIKDIVDDEKNDDGDSSLTDKIKDKAEEKNDEKIKDAVKDIVDNMDDDDKDDLIDRLKDDKQDLEQEKKELEEKSPRTPEEDQRLGEINKELETIEDLIDDLSKDPVKTDKLTDDELDKLKDVIKDQLEEEEEDEKTLDDLLKDKDLDDPDDLDDVIDALQEKDIDGNPTNPINDKELNDLLDKLKEEQDKPEEEQNPDKIEKLKDQIKDKIDEITGGDKNDDNSSLGDKIKDKVDPSPSNLTDKAIEDLVNNLDDDQLEKLIEQIDDEELKEKLRNADDLTPEDLDKIRDALSNLPEESEESKNIKDKIKDKVKDTFGDKDLKYSDKSYLRSNPYERKGYVFGGWRIAGTDTVITDESLISKLSASGDVKLEAVWIPIEYIITFEKNEDYSVDGLNLDGAVGEVQGEMEDMLVKYDESVKLTPNAYTRTGYVFLKWNTQADGSGTSYKDQRKIKSLTSIPAPEDGSTIYLYAQWSKGDYKVEFDPNGGEGTMEDQPMKFDVMETLTQNAFARTGYAFIGWSTEADGTSTTYRDMETVVNLTTEIDDVVTLYAQWLPADYVVVFEENGGTGVMSDQRMTFDDTYILIPNEFTRIGYQFTGWNTKADGTGKAYADKAEVVNMTSEKNGIVTLYAQWAPIQYVIHFNANGGKGTMLDQNMKFDVAAKLRANAFTRKGYKFTGWNTKADGSGTSYKDRKKVINLTDTNNGTVTLYAQWTKDTTTSGSKGGYSSGVRYTGVSPYTGDTTTPLAYALLLAGTMTALAAIVFLRRRRRKYGE